jgi:hypothetical protein
MGANAPDHRLSRHSPGVSDRNAWKSTLFLIYIVLVAAFFSSSVHAAELIVNPIQDVKSLDRETVRSMFTMRLRRWQDGTPVKVFVLPDRHELHREFSKKVLGVFPHQLRRAWDRMVFSGLGQAPVETADEEDMLKRVSETPGAVGYISGPDKGRGVSFVTVD